ncbi:hypothetical protein [Schumannella soli]|uniref:Uncharacterized protein n=1 Tax=Schumannella soli TaxID=2590779 RepID=A0A506Y5S3_9MICO|nr:hypothetical protein [Schumannella soli]TPW77986.1 hypothetical protein FJ657_04960 [Schumannella soli]
MDVTNRPDDRSKASTTGVRGNHAAHRTTSTASTIRSTAESDSGALVEHHDAVRDDVAHDTAAFDGALTEADLAFLAGAEIGAAVAQGAQRASAPAVDIVVLPPAPPVPPVRYGHLVWSILVAALVWCFAYIHAFDPGCAPDALGCTTGAAPSLLDVPAVAMVVASAIGAGAIGIAPWSRHRGLRAVVAISLGALMLGAGLLALGQLGQLG